MDSDIESLFGSIGSLFSDGDEIPWCDDPDVIPGCEKEVKEVSDGDSEEQKKESTMRMSWSLVHSHHAENIQSVMSKNFCNASTVIDIVKNKIERCITKYMSFEETMTYLHDNYHIGHHLTKTIWVQLQKESPDFFKNYNLRIKLASQIKMFNSLIPQQVGLMRDLDICHAPAYNLQQNPPGLALPNTSSQAANQLQDQHYQLQPYQSDANNDVVGKEEIAATDLWPLSNDLPYNNLGDPITAPWPPSIDLPYIEAPNTEPTTTSQQDPFAFNFTGDIGHSSLSFQHMEIDTVAQILGLSNGQCQPQHNFAPEEQQTLDNRGSNVVTQFGDFNDQQLYHNFDPNQPTPMHLQEAQGVTLNHHHQPMEHELRTIQLPETMLNNIYSGDVTLTMAQNQHDLQRQQQQTTKKRRTTS